MDLFSDAYPLHLDIAEPHNVNSAEFEGPRRIMRSFDNEWQVQRPATDDDGWKDPVTLISEGEGEARTWRLASDAADHASSWSETLRRAV